MAAQLTERGKSYCELAFEVSEILDKIAAFRHTSRHEEGFGAAWPEFEPAWSP